MEQRNKKRSEQHHKTMCVGCMLPQIGLLELDVDERHESNDLIDERG